VQVVVAARFFASPVDARAIPGRSCHDPDDEAMTNLDSTSGGGGQLPPIDTGGYLPRVKQVRWDHYYMEIALTVRKRANCLGAKIGAVLVVENRIVSTGFNGTPAGFPNCNDGGCVRCRDRYYGEIGHPEWASDPEIAQGATKQLDLCICVHAEANAMLTAARLGHRTTGSTLYATHKPCFMCLKEAVQAGVGRVVYLKDYRPTEIKSLLAQYEELAEFLRGNEQRCFEQLAAQSKLLVDAANAEPVEPNLDDWIAGNRPNDDDEAGLGQPKIPMPPEGSSAAKPTSRAARASGLGKSSDP
jgi:dCMP deaminase